MTEDEASLIWCHKTERRWIDPHTLDPCCCCIGADCMAWRWEWSADFRLDTGYCGLARPMMAADPTR